MTATDRSWVGVGDTPREAVEDLAPSQSQPDIAWVEGITAVPDRQPSRERPLKIDITIIYASRPPKQRKVAVSEQDGRWQATYLGGKTLPF